MSVLFHQRTKTCYIFCNLCKQRFVHLQLQCSATHGGERAPVEREWDRVETVMLGSTRAAKGKSRPFLELFSGQRSRGKHFLM